MLINRKSKLLLSVVKNHYFTLLQGSVATSCRWGEQIVIFRCQASSSLLNSVRLLYFTEYSQNKGWAFCEKYDTCEVYFRKLYHFGALVILHFCKGIFHWRVKLGWHIAFKLEALWHCTGVNRQLQMMWQQQVLSKFLYISGRAQPPESHRFSGDEKTRLQTWHLRSSGPTSALIFSGSGMPMSPVYSI